MKYRTLGKTNLEISEVGFGAWGIGGTHGNSTAYGASNDTDSINALEKAYELGINFFDTSNQYGQGHSEKLLGSTFKTKRDKVIIATKGGWNFLQNKKNFSKSYISQCLNESLTRLQSDYVDLYQLHSPDLQLEDQLFDLLDFLNKLKNEGKIRHIGISLASPDHAELAMDKYKFSVVQTNFNLVDQRILKSNFLQLAQNNNVGIIARTPLCFGILTGNYSKDSIFPEGDHRRNWSKEQVGRWCEALNLFCDTYRNAQVSNITSAQLALKFCLSFPEITTIIPGMLTEEHVIENSYTSECPEIPEDILNQFMALEKENDFFIR